MTENTLSILLLEDNSDHVELIRRALEGSHLGDELKVYENLADARQSIKLSTPGLVIADLNLPDGKGTDLIEISQGYSNYPVILMTSFGAKHSKQCQNRLNVYCVNGTILLPGNRRNRR
jgi:DNA-binding NtrC family response regulator